MSSANPFSSASSSQLITEPSRLVDPSSDAAQHAYTPPRWIQGSDSLGLGEEIPPAYTPSADIYHGESTIEVGPQRPFQQPPRPTHRPSHSTPHTQSESTSSWSRDSQPQLRPQSLPQQRPPLPPRPMPIPPPGPNLWSTYPAKRYERRGGGLVGTIVDTVRDVVDVVSGIHDEMRAPSQAYTGAYAAPYSQSSPSVVTQSHYTPSHYGSQRQASSVQHLPQSQVPSAQHLPQNQVADDGSPTRIPTPGHPLLHDGNILMYPNKGYFCAKCQNTGYKNYDPSHPCRKCWEKYGRPYVGLLTYTPWNLESASRASRFQRALPRFIPPQASQLPAEPPYSTGQLPNSFPPAAPAHYGENLYVCNPIIGMGEYPPVPHAVPVSPGNPRLGGQLCLKCGGTGILPFLIIDVRPCSLCGGVGRIL